MSTTNGEGGQPPERNPWKLATLSLAGAVVAVLAAGSVIALLNRSEAPTQAAALPPAAVAPTGVGPAPATPPLPASAAQSSAAPAPVSPAQAPKPPARRVASAETNAPPSPPRDPGYRSEPARPTTADIETCNRYASSQQSRTTEAVKDGVIGGVLGAALGAAGGAIAGGGGGAGKGAAIGGLVGVAGGSLYGINSANQNNQRAQAAYRDCMERRGYANASY
jgi:hypothetical protein